MIDCNHCYCIDVPASGERTNLHEKCCKCEDVQLKKLPPRPTKCPPNPHRFPSPGEPPGWRPDRRYSQGHGDVMLHRDIPKRPPIMCAVSA